MTKQDLRNMDSEAIKRIPSMKFHNEIRGLQKTIDVLKQTGFSKYIEEKKMSLLDSRYEIYDMLLEKGILK